MANNLGKKFEADFKKDFLKIPNATINRIYDLETDYKSGIKNVCDFIGYCYPYIFYAECKEHKQNTWPLKFSQYEDLLEKKNVPGAIAGVVLWFSDHDTVLFAPIAEIEKMKNDGCKSINIKMLDEKKYNLIRIPSTKKVVYLDCDYSVIFKEKANGHI